MLTFYVIALGGVAVVLLAIVLEAVFSVSRRPVWQVAHHRPKPARAPVRQLPVPVLSTPLPALPQRTAEGAAPRQPVLAEPGA